jgi:hypothetical protein
MRTLPGESRIFTLRTNATVAVDDLTVPEVLRRANPLAAPAEMR